MNHRAAKPKKAFAIQPSRKAAANPKSSGPYKNSFLPCITRAIVRKHLHELYKNIMLDHQPPTAEEWVLAEWYVAQALGSSPLHSAPFALDAVRRRSGNRPATEPARRYHLKI